MVAQDALFKMLVKIVYVGEDVEVLQGSKCEHYGDGSLDTAFHLDVPKQDSRHD